MTDQPTPPPTPTTWANKYYIYVITKELFSKISDSIFKIHHPDGQSTDEEKIRLIELIWKVRKAEIPTLLEERRLVVLIEQELMKDE